MHPAIDYFAFGRKALKVNKSCADNLKYYEHILFLNLSGNKD